MRGGADSPGLETSKHTSNRVTRPQQWIQQINIQSFGATEQAHQTSEQSLGSKISLAITCINRQLQNVFVDLRVLLMPSTIIVNKVNM